MDLIIELMQQAMPELLKRSVLDIPLKQRAKFEGWLKVELGAALRMRGLQVRLEHHYHDPSGKAYHADLALTAGKTVEEHLVMLKTVNTSFRFDTIEQHTRPITKNINGVIEDIDKLMSLPDTAIGYVLFVVFPVSSDRYSRREQLKQHLDRIASQPVEFLAEEFVPRHPAWGINWYLAKVNR